MLLGIDRVIVPIEESELDELTRRLVEAGLVHVGDTGLDDHPTADAHFALEGGGFVELVWERQPGSSPFRTLFEDMPRIAGLGFTSDEFDGDRQRFAGESTAWFWERPSDDSKFARSAGPATVGEEDPYLFLIDDRQLPYADSGAAGRLTEIVVEGTSAPECRRRYADALAVEWEGDQFVVGGTTVRFRERGPLAAVTSLTIEGARVSVELELSRGAISFKR